MGPRSRPSARSRWSLRRPELVEDFDCETCGRHAGEGRRRPCRHEEAHRPRGLIPTTAQADNGALHAWAWGAGRALDYFETDKTVDAKQVGIEGLSRYGKAAIVAMQNVAGAGGDHWMDSSPRWERVPYTNC